MSVAAVSTPTDIDLAAHYNNSPVEAANGRPTTGCRSKVVQANIDIPKSQQIKANESTEATTKDKQPSSSKPRQQRGRRVVCGVSALKYDNADHVLARSMNKLRLSKPGIGKKKDERRKTTAGVVLKVSTVKAAVHNEVKAAVQSEGGVDSILKPSCLNQVLSKLTNTKSSQVPRGTDVIVKDDQPKAYSPTDSLTSGFGDFSLSSSLSSSSKRPFRQRSLSAPMGGFEGNNVSVVQQQQQIATPQHDRSRSRLFPRASGEAVLTVAFGDRRETKMAFEYDDEDITSEEEEIKQLSCINNLAISSSPPQSEKAGGVSNQNVQQQQQQLINQQQGDPTCSHVSESCAHQFREEPANYSDVSVDELSGFLEDSIIFPKKMSEMAEMMYT